MQVERDAPGAVLRSQPLRLVTGALGLEVVVLALTGVALFFEYRPTAAGGWGDVGQLDSSVTLALALRRVHQWTALLTMATAVAAAALLVTGPARGRGGARWALGGGLVAVPIAAWFTGLLLPWDQLALWAVRVGVNLGGYEALLGDEVRFLIIDGAEVGPGTILAWLAVHGLVLGPAAGGLALVAWRRAGP